MARITVALNLVYGQDDDLIQFIESYQKGERNQVLKAALRHALATGEEIKIPVNGHSNGTEARIAELEAAVAWLTSRLEEWSFNPAAYAHEPQVEAAPRLSDDELQQRAAKLKKANW